ncbi:MAG: DUF3343 domain-containing protein [Clostridia bacterium]|nr:DUF3343 domain-containing protein [Clostridia bacterium]
MYYYIVYSSVTVATSIRNKFRYDEQRISVVHTPAVISNAGCSYSIKLKSESKAMEIIKTSMEYGAKIRGFYRQNDKGIFEKINF